MEQKLNFIGFIQKYFPEYKIDPKNEQQISQVSAWAERAENFHEMGDRFHLNKSMLFLGPVGTGKTDLMRLLKKYFQEYCRSFLNFSVHTTWKYASEFEKDGYKAFDGHEKNNRCYDELCLIDGRQTQPLREYVSHFGNKLLIGEEIIMLRYEAFKHFGYMTHFTTNADYKQLRDVYGERAFDRLIEMCNFIVFQGESRRWMADPNLYTNLNKPLESKETKEIPAQEHESIKRMLDTVYQTWLQDGETLDTFPILFNSLEAYGCNVRPENLYDELLQEGRKAYGRPLGKNMSDQELESERMIYATTHAKKLCVATFFWTLQQNGAQSIFQLKVVEMPEVLGGEGKNV